MIISSSAIQSQNCGGKVFLEQTSHQRDWNGYEYRDSASQQKRWVSHMHP